MGICCGFDIYPRLESNAVNQEMYQRFLDEITHKFDSEYITEPRSSTPANQKLLVSEYPGYLSFAVGEWPKMPKYPEFCNYFLRFSSKYSGNLGMARDYIRSVHKIAQKYFGSRVRFWDELNDEDYVDPADWRLPSQGYGLRKMQALEIEFRELMKTYEHAAKEPSK